MAMKFQAVFFWGSNDVSWWVRIPTFRRTMLLPSSVYPTTKLQRSRTQNTTTWDF